MSETKAKSSSRTRGYFALWAWMTVLGVFMVFLSVGLNDWLHAYPKYVQPNGELTETGKWIKLSIYLPLIYVFSQLILTYVKRRKQARDVLPKP